MAEAPFYLSFAADDGYRGACFVLADPDAPPMDPRSPVGVAWARGCNPGGEVMVMRLADSERVAKIPAEFWHVLLTRSDLESLGEIIEPGGGEIVEGTAEELSDRFQRGDG